MDLIVGKDMRNTSDMRIKLSCRNVWKAFGPRPEKAIESISEDMTKDEVLAKTGHVVAVRDASFDVREGEVFMIMGLSGSGKSTIARCLNGLLKPTRGEVIIDGVNIAAMSEKELRRTRRNKVSMVFQHFALFPHRSVLDNVAYGLEVQGMDKSERRKKAFMMLDKVGLEGWENNLPWELSGGMQQRVGLARALAPNPEILLMDEAFSALDPLIRRQMQDEFITLMEEEKKTIVFISHDLNEALMLGSRVAIMKDGRIVQIGSPEEIVCFPADDYVAEFVRDVSRYKIVPVKSIMNEPAFKLKVTDKSEAALKEMKDKNMDRAFVIDDDNRLRGIVTDAEVIQAINCGKLTLEEIQLSNDTFIKQEQPIGDLVCLVAACDNSVPVIDGNQRLIGEITRVGLLYGILGEENRFDATQKIEAKKNAR
jgi:glycine betaine/proline transport system ATP-binding protein